MIVEKNSFARLIVPPCDCANCALYSALIHSAMIDGIAKRLLAGGLEGHRKKFASASVPFQLFVELAVDADGVLLSGTYVELWGKA